MGNAPRRMVVGITGATGIVYGVRLLQALRELKVESHLIVSKAGEMTRAYETDMSSDELRSLAAIIFVRGICRNGLNAQQREQPFETFVEILVDAIEHRVEIAHVCLRRTCCKLTTVPKTSTH